MLSVVGNWLARYFSPLLVAVAVGYVLADPPPTTWPVIRWDGDGYHLWTYALIQGDLNFERFASDHVNVGLYPIPGRPGWWHNKYPPGVALIRLPVMAWFVDRQSPKPVVTEKERIASLLLGGSALLAVTIVALRSCRQLQAPLWASHFAVLAIVFGTGLFHYGTFETSYSHIWSALGLALLVDRSLTFIQTPGVKPSTVPFFALSLLLVLIRQTNLLAILVLVGFVFCMDGRGRSPRLWLPVLVGSAVGVVLLFGLNSYAHQRLVWSGYAGEDFLWHRPMLVSVLFSFEQGLFLYWPIVGIVAVTGWMFHRTRRATLGFCILLGSFALLYGFWHSWTLAGGFGHRGFTELMPAAIPLLAIILGEASRRGRILLMPLLVVAVFITLEMLHGYWRDTLPWHSATRADYLDHLVGGSSWLRWR